MLEVYTVCFGRTKSSIEQSLYTRCRHVIEGAWSGVNAVIDSYHWHSTWCIKVHICPYHDETKSGCIVYNSCMVTELDRLLCALFLTQSMLGAKFQDGQIPNPPALLSVWQKNYGRNEKRGGYEAVFLYVIAAVLYVAVQAMIGCLVFESYLYADCRRVYV